MCVLTEIYVVTLAMMSSTDNSIDLTITTDKLMEQFASLDPEKVDDLGDEHRLDLPKFEMGIIKKNYQNPTQRKEAYLDLYVHQHPCPSWATIAGALRQSWIGLRQQADFVENTYVKGTILYVQWEAIEM